MYVMEKAPFPQRFLKALPYITLALELFCVVMGTILFLAFGLDQYDYFFKPPFAICSLPYGLAFPVYIVMETIGTLLSGKEGYCLCPLLGKPSKTRTFTSLGVTIASIVGASIGNAMLSPKEPVIAACMLGLMSLVGLLIYLVFGIIEMADTDTRPSSFWGSVGFLGVGIAVAIAGFALGLNVHHSFVMLYAALGLICVSMTMLGRQEAR